MRLLLILALLIAFFATFFAVKIWIRKAKQVGLMWEDRNKFKRPLVAGSGGVGVVTGFVLGVFAYIAIKTFVFHDNSKVIEILALMSSILILAGIGIIDDLLGWQHGGLSKRFRLLMCIFAAIPLVVINAGTSTMVFPFFGKVDIGLLFPLFLIPLGITGASTTFNFLAGFNGLEASQGLLILLGLAIVSAITGNSWLGFILLIMAVSLLAFYKFNKFPAKVFPGDVMTYPVGGLIAIAAILGNLEKIAFFFFMIYVAETFLKLRGGLAKYSFGKPNKDNSLEMAYNKFYGVEHIAIFMLGKIKKKVYEKDVVYFINAMQILIILAGFAIFKNAIFSGV